MIALLTLVAATGTDAFLAAESLPAVAVRAVPAHLEARLWNTLPAHAIRVATQQSVHLNDAFANRSLSRPPDQVKLRAAYDDRSLGIVLEWSDDTESSAVDVDRFLDGAALQVPMGFGHGVRLPYIGMGDEEHHVAIHLVRPGAAREMVAAGFGSSTRAELGAKMSMRYDARGRTWRALFVRPLLEGGLVPFAIAIWDGGQHERGGNKSISGWKFLRLSKRPIDAAYLSELAFGYGPGEMGDPMRGKPLVHAMCTACHHMGEVRTAPKGIAPDLSKIGLIASPRYLFDSILAPNAPVVPHLHTPIQWTTMPSFEGLPETEVGDMAAYLWTLGREQ
jgi:complex iron-sulfur molybdoenzyme family reductase subunit gamma